MHHGTDADGCQCLDFHFVLLQHVLAQLGIAVLKTIPDGFGAVGPKAVHQLVFPGVAALCDRLVVLVDENCLDAGRAKLDSENGFT